MSENTAPKPTDRSADDSTGAGATPERLTVRELIELSREAEQSQEAKEKLAKISKAIRDTMESTGLSSALESLNDTFRSMRLPDASQFPSLTRLSRPANLMMLPDIKMPEVVPPTPVIARASEIVARLVKQANEFNEGLDDEHEIGIKAVSFGQSLQFHVDCMTAWDPSLILFRGRMEDGSPVELIQHISQLSFLMMKLPRLEPTTPRRPIGFSHEGFAETE